MTEAQQKELAKKAGAFPDLMQRWEQPFMKALPKHLGGDRFVRMVMTCFRQSQQLQRCDPQALLGAFFELAQLGLEPNTPLDQAWVIPYGTTPQVIIGYKGMVNLAYRAGVRLMASEVYEGDDFAYQLGTEPMLRHVPVGNPAKRGALKYAYAIAYYENTEPLFRVVDEADIEDAKAASSAYQRGQKDKNKRDSPWYTNPASMWRKTAVRRLAPFLPMAAELQRAASLDAAAERGDEQRFDIPEMIEGEPIHAEARADTLEDRLKDAKPAG